MVPGNSVCAHSCHVHDSISDQGIQDHHTGIQDHHTGKGGHDHMERADTCGPAMVGCRRTGLFGSADDTAAYFSAASIATRGLSAGCRVAVGSTAPPAN